MTSNAVDGNTSTYWESSNGAAFPQTLTADLHSSQSLGSVKLFLPPPSTWATRNPTWSSSSSR